MQVKKTIRLNIPISKVDEEQRTVTGIATSEALDSQGDIVDYDASKKAFSDWKGNIREMHGPVAIGKGIDVQFDDDNKQIIVTGKISQSADGENAWVKVKEGILTGFSIGGKVFQIVKDKAVEGATRVTDYALSELSLVDNPANPEAELLMVKSVDGNLQRVEQPQIHDQPLPAAWWAQKFMGAPMKKSVYDAQEALSIASQLTWLILTEEPDQRADLIAAFNALRDFAAKEVAEGDDFDWASEYQEVIELANKAINLRKERQMSDKKVEKTNVVAGEERNQEAKVTESAEQAGRPINDTKERADAANVPEAGAPVNDKGKQVDEDKATAGADLQYADDDKTKTPDDTARNDITPPEDKKVVDPKDVTEATNEQTLDAKEQTVNDTKQDRSPAIALPADPTKPEESTRTESSTPTNTSEPKKDEKKSDDPSDLLKSIETSMTKLLDERENADLKKVADAIKSDLGKVVKSVDSLEGRVKALEDQPMPSKGKQYQVVSKGDGTPEVNDEVKELLKRQDHLIEHPHDAKPGEMADLAMKLRKAHLGQPITVN